MGMGDGAACRLSILCCRAMVWTLLLVWTPSRPVPPCPNPGPGTTLCSSLRGGPRGPVLTCGPQLTLVCDFRAVQALCRPLPLCPVPWPGNQPSLAREAAVSGLGSTLRSPPQAFAGGPRDPMFSLVVRAAAANVNPRTRLSHMTLFSGRDWCTRERYRLMMQDSRNSLQMTPRILRRAREFPRILPGFSDKVRRRPGLEHTTPTHSPTPPLKPAACSTEAWCVTHGSLVRDALKLGA